MELVLVRHGESTGNLARERAEATGADVIPVEARDADVALSALGVRQAEALGRRLGGESATAPIDAVWTSPYARARQTAQVALAAAQAALVPRVDERLRDKELGVLDTLTSRGVHARFPEEAVRRRWLGKFYYRAPGGESWADVALRLRSVLGDVLRAPAPERVLVVAHDAPILLLRYICEDLLEEQVLELARRAPVGNAAVTRLRQGADGRWTAVEENDQHHLVLADGTDLRTLHPAEAERP